MSWYWSGFRCHCPGIRCKQWIPRFRADQCSGFRDFALSSIEIARNYTLRYLSLNSTRPRIKLKLELKPELKLGPGFHCSNGSTLSCTKSVGLCVVMMKVSLSYDHWSLRKWRIKIGKFLGFFAKKRFFFRKKVYFDVPHAIGGA